MFTYTLIRENGEKVVINQPVEIATREGISPRLTVTLWMGRNETLGPHGYEVGTNVLTMMRSPHPIVLPTDGALVDNMMTFAPEYFKGEDVSLNLAGERIKITCQQA